MRDVRIAGLKDGGLTGESCVAVEGKSINEKECRYIKRKNKPETRWRRGSDRGWKQTIQRRRPLSGRNVKMSDFEPKSKCFASRLIVGITSLSV